MTRPGKTGAPVRELTPRLENTPRDQELALLEPGSRARARDRRWQRKECWLRKCMFVQCVSWEWSGERRLWGVELQQHSCGSSQFMNSTSTTTSLWLNDDTSLSIQLIHRTQVNLGRKETPLSLCLMLFRYWLFEGYASVRTHVMAGYKSWITSKWQKPLSFFFGGRLVANIFTGARAAIPVPQKRPPFHQDKTQCCWRGNTYFSHILGSLRSSPYMNPQCVF